MSHPRCPRTSRMPHPRCPRMRRPVSARLLTASSRLPTVPRRPAGSPAGLLGTVGSLLLAVKSRAETGLRILGHLGCGILDVLGHLGCDILLGTHVHSLRRCRDVGGVRSTVCAASRPPAN